MTLNGSQTPTSSRRQGWVAIGLGWRILLALLLSFLIMMVFFATSATSH